MCQHDEPLVNEWVSAACSTISATLRVVNGHQREDTQVLPYENGCGRRADPSLRKKHDSSTIDNPPAATRTPQRFRQVCGTRGDVAGARRYLVPDCRWRVRGPDRAIRLGQEHIARI